jgi:sugar phosphate isomerase/epimerase
VSTGVLTGDVDLQLLERFDPDIVEVYARTRAELDAIHGWAKDERVALSLHVPTPLDDRTLIAAGFEPTGDDVAVERAVDLVRSTLDAADDLGAAHVVVHVPGPTPEVGGARAVADRAVAFLHRCLAGRAPSAVRLLVENVSSNRAFGQPEEYAALLAAVPGTGFCLDIGHAEDLQPRAGVDQFVDVLGPATAAVHVYWPTDREGGRTLGAEGSWEHRRVVEVLRRLAVGPSSVDAVLELRPLDAAGVSDVLPVWRATRALI